jgi:erythronate-4-phosphate dehydrogenase
VAFASLGSVQRVRGRELSRELLLEADLLLCRSTVKINAALLDGTPVRFVATATVGTDHVDLAYLRERGLGFASAEGSSTRSVAEWVICALLLSAGRRRRRLAGASLGIVGVGRVGSAVAARAVALGMRPVLVDPPRAEREGPDGFASLDEALACDYLTVHTPLIRQGPHATFHLIDAARLARLSPEAVVINAARGPVIEGPALLAALQAGQLGGALLDCWEGEPRIDAELLDRVALGTPHIAGHSLDAKAEGTRMIFEAARQHLLEQGPGAKVPPSWDPRPLLPPPRARRVRLSTDASDDEEVAAAAARLAYDLAGDDARLREGRGAHFDALREAYPPRRDFPALEVELDPWRPGPAHVLATLGFRVAAPSA